MSIASILGDSSTAEPQALNLLILVRIQVPQHSCNPFEHCLCKQVEIYPPVFVSGL